MGYKASTKQMIHHRESSLRRLLETYKRKHSIIMLIMSLLINYMAHSQN